MVVLETDKRVVTALRGAHEDTVTSVAIGPGRWIAAGSADRTVKLREVPSTKPEGFAALRPVLTLRFDGGVWPSATTVVVAGERGVRRWRLDQLSSEMTDLGLSPRWLTTPVTN